VRDIPCTATYQEMLISARSHTSKIDPYCRAHPELCIGGQLDRKYFSKKGAFNGTGIALAGESWNKEQRKIFTVYFQHWTGDLRFLQYTTDKKWIGGSKAQTIATDAKNSTPISAVAYSLNSTQVVRIPSHFICPTKLSISPGIVSHILRI